MDLRHLLQIIPVDNYIFFLASVISKYLTCGLLQ